MLTRKARCIPLAFIVALLQAGQAETVAIPFKLIDYRFAAQSGHVPLEWRPAALAGGNYALWGTKLVFTIPTPPGYTACYAVVSEVDVPQGVNGFKVGRSADDHGEKDSPFTDYQITVVASPDPPPSWAGNTTKIRVLVAAYASEFVVLQPGHPETPMPALLTRAPDGSRKVTCQQNVVLEHDVNGPFDEDKRSASANDWHDQVLQMDMSLPPDCPVIGFPAPGSPNFAHCSPH